MQQPTSDIVVIGSNMVDLITYVDWMPKMGETLEAPSFEIGCGGKGANQAVAAAKLGASVMMVSKVGDDLFADNTIRNLQSYGIDIRHVEKVPRTSSGVAPIFVDKQSQNCILIVKGANNHLMPTDIDAAADQIKRCKLMVLQLEIPLETVYYAIDFANRHQIPVILNPAPALKALDIHYACRCDFFIPNETELEILTGMPVETLSDIISAAKTLMDKGLKNILVTIGERGCWWMSKNGSQHLPSVAVAAVDTSGAGDAFIGCFAHYYVQNANVIEAMKQACAYAALSVTGRGTQSSYPSLAQFNAFQSQASKGISHGY